MHLMPPRMCDNLFIFSCLLSEDPADRDENKKENLDLSALSVRRADVSLKKRISQCEHQTEEKGRECLPQSVPDRVNDADDHERQHRPPKQHFREGYCLAHVCGLPGKRSE